jgi:tetratricopeptide (TPR) repeat protein
MGRRASILILALLIGFAGACTKSEKVDPAELAWSELAEHWSDLESAEEKTRLAEDYLTKYPDTEHSGLMAARVVYYRGHEMEDPQGAFDAVYSALDQIEDPEQRFEVSMRLFDLSDSVEIPLDVAEVAGALEAVRPLGYDEHQWVVETAVDLEDWLVASRHARAAFELATPDVFRAENQDREYSDEKVASFVRLRKAQSLAYEAWALYNQGSVKLAFERFADADAVGSVNYVGVPDNPLYTFWGRAALAEGEIDQAIKLLGAETLFGWEASSAEPYLREAYVAKNGDDDGFDEFLWTTRKDLAKTVDDFTLLDYSGNAVSMAETSAGKVTLLAFWFPT